MLKSLNVYPLMGWCSVFLCLSIVLGAFGSHALTKVLSVQKLDVFNKANHYLSIQSIGILILLLVNNTTKIQISTLSIYSLFAGMAIFCTALYLVSFSEMEGLAVLRKFGMVAPVGGLLMILGWAFAARDFFRVSSL
jgi:uncharacterized membrane protein YgdD (TMEM256/DUF423 family)